MSGKANQLTFQKNFIAQKVRDEVKLASGDLLEMKRFEPAMRHLLDMYIRADDSEVLMDFEDFGLIDLVVNNNGEGMDKLPKGLRDNEDAMAEAIENNVRKTIVDENPVNPKYFDQMSTLLEELIKQRREKALNYQEYLEKIRELAKILIPQLNKLFSITLVMMILTTKIDTAVRFTKRADWLGDRFKEREIANAIREETASYGIDVAAIMELIKAQKNTINTVNTSFR